MPNLNVDTHWDYNANKFVPGPKPDYTNTPMCKNHALFFAKLPSFFMIVLPIILCIIAICLTNQLRSITPGVCPTPSPAKPETTTANETTTDGGNREESTAIPDPETFEQTGILDEEQPPPYQPPTPPTSPPTILITPSPTLSTSQKPKRTSAHLFIHGTFLLSLLPLCFFLIALCIQNLDYCHDYSPLTHLERSIFWILFCIPLLWATTGLCCWFILLRDLWGPKMKDKVKIKDTMIVLGVFYVVFSPVILLGVVGMLGRDGGVWVVERMQRNWCADALEGDEEEGGAGSDGVELEEGMAGDGGEGSGDGGSERVGLMVGMDK